jgi:hypothetical protein
MSNQTRNDDPVEVNCVLLFDNEESYKIEDADGREIFLPKLHCALDPKDAEEGEDITVTMPEWLAVEKGLV